MPIGPLVRAALGPLEPRVADLYRRFFIDLGAFAEALAARHRARRILEIGCGEGALATQLLRTQPDAELVAIDPTPRVGRLFAGDPARVRFRALTMDGLAAEHPPPFDLVVLCDVLHHVPAPAQAAFLAQARGFLAPGGLFALKDWTRSATPAHLLCWLSDRFVTGDRQVNFRSRPELVALLHEAFGPGARLTEAHVPPWSNNLALFVA